MPKVFKVDVVQDDFDLGEMRNSNRCAVKLAVARCVPGATRVEVDLQTVRFSLNGERHVFLTPWTVSDYVIAYDAEDIEELRPFRFELRPSAQVGSKVRRKIFTSEGKEIDNARNRVRKAEARKEKALAVAADPEQSTPVEVAKAQETLESIDAVIAECKRELAETRKAVAATGKPRTKRVDTDLPKPPRKHKTRTRHFGRRELRVNKQEGRWHTPSVRPPAEYQPVE